MSVRLIHGDCTEVLPKLPRDFFDAVVCDPPYHLTSVVKRFGGENAAPAKFGTDGAFARASKGFMGKTWDGGDVAFRPETWVAVLEAMKPGAYLLAFGGTRTFHRMAVAIEDAGFEIRDTVMYLYGTGFPKSHDVSKAIDKAAGAEREVIRGVRAKGGGTEQINRKNAHTHDYRPGDYQKGENVLDITAPATDAAREWEGWGTALKPAYEPIIVARKPLVGTVAENVLQFGTGALNIDACRVEGIKDTPASPRRAAQNATYGDLSKDPGTGSGWNPNTGRWPANVIHDGSDEVINAFPDAPGQQGKASSNEDSPRTRKVYGKLGRSDEPMEPRGDAGSAARFFYCAKATKADRAGSGHPTVKPIALMRYLCKLVTPPNGIILDPFAGSGTTGAAAVAEGFRAVLIEQSEEYCADIRRRFAKAA